MAKINDKQCRGCGYELNGLGPQGRCPECGGVYDIYTGEGIAGTMMDKHRRGERVVTLLQTLGLVFAAVLLVGVGALYYWLKQNHAVLILMGVVAAIFLVSAVSTGWSLKRR